MSKRALFILIVLMSLPAYVIIANHLREISVRKNISNIYHLYLAENIANSAAEMIIRKLQDSNSVWDFTEHPDGLVREHPLQDYVEWCEVGGSYRIKRMEKDNGFLHLTVSGRYRTETYNTEVEFDMNSCELNSFDYALFARELLTINDISYINSYDPDAEPGKYSGNTDHARIGTAGGTESLEYEGTIFGESLYYVEHPLPVPLAPGGGAPLSIGAADNEIQIIESGKYRIKDDVFISGKNGLEINGDVTLYMDKDFAVEDSRGVRINKGSSLLIYISGNMDIGGVGFVNENESATGLMIYGTGTCREISIRSPAENKFTGVVYAPEALITIQGSPAGIFGAFAGKEVHLKGDPESSMYYDQTLKRIGKDFFHAFNYQIAS